jgi:hypothetical protein
MNWQKRIFEIQTEADFEALAIEVYEFQRANNPIYQQFLQLTNRWEVQNLSDITFLPIQFFKYHEVLSVPKYDNHTLFLSSGTGLIGRSKHYIQDISWYEISFQRTYRLLFGHPENQVILALLPNYLEQGHSSLVYMVRQLIAATKNELSGFVLGQAQDLLQRYEAAIQQGKEVVVFGVSYALLDLLEMGVKIPFAKIIETGGMKGRRKEETKAVLHEKLKNGFDVTNIYSEYGMTELLSQAYSLEFNDFRCPPWMKVLFGDMNDPFTLTNGQRKSRLNIIDLANFQTCSFIQTEDTGRKTNLGFSLEGRMDLSEIRGCNLMMEDAE